MLIYNQYTCTHFVLFLDRKDNASGKVDNIFELCDLAILTILK